MIALIDYGAGNLTSVRKGFAAAGADLFTPADPSALAGADGIVVPGVGHFGATAALDGAWTAAIRRAAGLGTPLLGICLGMQWLYEGSDESPDLPGLGLLSGRCYRLGATVRLKPDTTYDADSDSRSVRLPADRDVKVPHVGWNSLTILQETSMVEGVPSGAQVYFTHSYVGPVNGDTVAVTEHGAPFAAIVQRGHVAGVQFHPEKSGDVGLRTLRNFLELVA
jgi:imidazole glycerol-phosphate synthase subunit HisH